MSDLIEEESVLSLPRARAALIPKLTCVGCKGFYRGPTRFCPNGHGICSICLPENKTLCLVEGCDKEAVVSLDFLGELVKDLRLPVACKGPVIEDVRLLEYILCNLSDLYIRGLP